MTRKSISKEEFDIACTNPMMGPSDYDTLPDCHCEELKALWIEWIDLQSMPRCIEDVPLAVGRRKEIIKRIRELCDD